MPADRDMILEKLRKVGLDIVNKQVRSCPFYRASMSTGHHRRRL